MSYLTRWFLVFLMVWVPFASHAQLVPLSQARQQLSETDRQLFDRADKVFGQQGFQTLIDHQNRKAVILDPKNPGSPGLEIPFSDEKELRKFSPARLKAEFLTGMANAKPIDTFHKTYKRFPYESVMFFMAIGAVMMFQLSTDYGSNPVRMKQHMDHSISPLGMFSFFAFMYANGVTTNVLSVWMKNPKFHAFIPYLGMSAGFFVQSTIASFAADPEVKSCVAGLLGKKSEQEGDSHCEKAFSFYVLKKKFAEMAPGLVSMLASTLIAGLVQKGLTATVLKLTGVDIALWFVPGGVGVQAVRFVVLSGLQMALFYYIDVGFLNRKISYAWGNFWDGLSLGKHHDRLNEILLRKKANGWADEWTDRSCSKLKKDLNCEADFASELKRFQESMGAWRMLNLIEVFEGHQAWQDQLAQLNANYNLTYSFYREFIEEARNSAFGFVKPQRLDFVDALAGVRAKGLQENAQHLYHLKPHFTQNAQMDHLEDIAAGLERRLQSGELRHAVRYPMDVAFVKEFVTKLKSEKIQDKSQALFDLNERIRESRQSVVMQPQFRQFLHDLHKEIGAPQPVREPGRGFLYTFESHSEAKPLFETARFPQFFGPFKNLRPTEYLLTQMVCGPEAGPGSKLITTSLGFPSVFHPPRVTNATDAETNICYGSSQFTPSVLYRLPLADERSQYVGVQDFVKRNILPEIFGDRQKGGFTEWWESTTQSQLKAAYMNFSVKYDDLVVRMLRQLNEERDSAWNTGPAANGTFPSIRQQMRYNLIVLGELLKDAHFHQRKSSLPVSHFNSRQEPEPNFTPARGSGQSMRILKGLKNDEIYEWDRWLRRFKEHPASKVARPQGMALQLQKEVAHEFETLMWLFTKLKIVKVEDPSETSFAGFSTGTRERVQSTLEITELEQQGEKITAKLTEFAVLLGVSDKTPAPPALVNLSPEQREIALALLTGLNSLIQEISTFAMMAHAVSWDKIRDSRGLAMRQQEMSSKTQEQLKSMSNILNRGR